MTQHHMPHMRSTAGLTLNDSVYERLLRERIVFLGSEVDDEIANRITAQLLLLEAEDPKRDMKARGGCPEHATGARPWRPNPGPRR